MPGIHLCSPRTKMRACAPLHRLSGQADRVPDRVPGTPPIAPPGGNTGSLFLVRLYLNDDVGHHRALLEEDGFDLAGNGEPVGDTEVASTSIWMSTASSEPM